MKWVIEILNNRLRQMNDAYEKYVLNGNVNTDSPNAVENRKKAKQLSNAIKILSATVNTSDGQLTIPPVIKSLPNLDIDKAETLAISCNYATFAVGDDVNTADAGAFFLEGYLYAQRLLGNVL